MTSEQRPPVNNGNSFWVPRVVVEHKYLYEIQLPLPLKIPMSIIDKIRVVDTTSGVFPLLRMLNVKISNLNCQDSFFPLPHNFSKLASFLDNCRVACRAWNGIRAESRILVAASSNPDIVGESPAGWAFHRYVPRR